MELAGLLSIAGLAILFATGHYIFGVIVMFLMAIGMAISAD